MIFRYILGMAGLSLCAVLSACIGYVDVPAQQPVTARTYGGTLDEALQQVRDFRNAYIGRYTGMAAARGGVGTVMYGLIGSTIGLAATKGLTPAFAAAVGVGGATAYALGDYLVSAREQRILQTGAQAVVCVEARVNALMITKERFDIFKADATDLGSRIARLEASRAPLPDGFLNDARRVYGAASALIERVEAAKDETDHQLYVIKFAVDDQVLSTEPDLQSIFRSSNALSSLAGAIVPGSAARFAAAAGTQQSARAGAAQSDLEAAANDILSMSPYIERVATADRKLGELSTCLPKDQLPPRLSLPANILVMGPSETRQFGVQAQGVPSAAITDGAEGVAASVQVADGFTLVKVTSSTAAAGDRTLTVRDITNKTETTAVVRITGNTGGGSGSGSGSGSGGGGGGRGTANPASGPSPTRGLQTNLEGLKNQDLENTKSDAQRTALFAKLDLHIPTPTTCDDQNCRPRVRALHNCIPGLSYSSQLS